MNEKTYYCVDCDIKMHCIAANLASPEMLCLKEEVEKDINE